MFEFIFIFLFIVFPLLIHFFYKFVLKESLFEVNIINFLLINFFVFAYIGIFFLYFYLDPLRVANGVVDRKYIFLMWVFSSLSILFIVLGSYFAKVNISINEVIPYSLKKTNEHIGFSRWKSYIFILFGILVIALYIRVVPDVAIFKVFDFDGKTEIQSLRSDMGNSFQGSYLMYSVFMRDTLQFLLFAFYAQWLVFNKKVDLTIVFILFSICCFVALMATEKAPIVWLLIGLFLVNIVTKKNSQIPLKEVIKILIPLFTLLIALYMFFMKSFSVSDAFTSILSRTFTGSITPAYFYLELFPKHFDYLYGKSFPNPKGIFPYEPIKLPVFVMDWVNPHLEQLGIVGSMPTVFWAEIYANFGFMFIAPFSFLIGFIIKVLDRLVLTLRANPLYIGYYVWVILYFKDLSITSFSNFIFNIALVVVTFIFIFISMSNFKLKYTK